jgi:hypothetical protein
MHIDMPNREQDSGTGTDRSDCDGKIRSHRLRSTVFLSSVRRGDFTWLRCRRILVFSALSSSILLRIPSP